MTTRTVLIERAARAICLEDGGTWSELTVIGAAYYGALAAAALDALVPPGEAATTETGVLAQIMFHEGFATGHGDTFDDMLDEFRWQVCERAERNRLAKESMEAGHG